MADYRLCDECDKPMRPYGTLLADHPGTVKSNGKRCGGCANQARASELAYQSGRPTVEQNRASLLVWLREQGRQVTSV